MRNIIILITLLITSVLSYGQNKNKIRIEHIGSIDKPFPVIELYNSGSINTAEINKKTVVIQDSSAFLQTVKYFNEKYVGKVDSSDTNYGTFSVSFYSNGKFDSKVFLNKEGAVYFFVNLHTYLMFDEKNKNIIYSIVRRLL